MTPRTTTCSPARRSPALRSPALRSPALRSSALRSSALRSSALRGFAVAIACASPLLAGCSANELEEDAPAEDPGTEVDGGAVGPDTRVSDDVSLLQVQRARGESPGQPRERSSRRSAR